MILWLKYAPWMVAVLILFGAGTYTGWHLNPWQERFQRLQATDTTERLREEESARKALSAQIAQAQEITRNNQAAMVTLANQNAQTAADHDLVVARVHRLERLLSATATRTAASDSVPKADDRSPAIGASGDDSIRGVGELLVAARNECRRNNARFQALIAEITPQLH